MGKTDECLSFQKNKQTTTTPHKFSVAFLRKCFSIHSWVLIKRVEGQGMQASVAVWNTKENGEWGRGGLSPLSVLCLAKEARFLGKVQSLWTDHTCQDWANPQKPVWRKWLLEALLWHAHGLWASAHATIMKEIINDSTKACELLDNPGLWGM